VTQQDTAHLHIRFSFTKRNFVLHEPEWAIVTWTIRSLSILSSGRDLCCSLRIKKLFTGIRGGVDYEFTFLTLVSV